MVKYCEACEKEVSGEDINFCPNCGGKLTEKVEIAEEQKEQSVTEKNEVHENLLFEKSKDLGKITYKWISTKVKIDGDDIWIVQEVKKIFRKTRRKENGILASDIKSISMQVKWDFWDTLYGIIFIFLGVLISPWYFIFAVLFLLYGYGKIITLKVTDGSEYVIPVEGETLDSVKLMNYCTEKLGKNANFVYSEEKHKQDGGESKKSKCLIVIISIIGVALIVFVIPFVLGQKEDKKIEQSEKVIKKLQDFTVIKEGDNEYNFEFSDKWRLQYVDGNVSARIKEDQIVSILSNAFEETDLGLKGEFAYDLDKGDLNIFMDAETSEGWVTRICYNLNEEDYTISIVTEEHELSEEFREYLDDCDFDDILKRDVDSFVNTLEENGLTLEDVESLDYSYIGEIVGDESVDNTYEEVEADKEIIENNIDTDVVHDKHSTTEYIDVSEEQLLRNPEQYLEKKIRIYTDYMTVMDENSLWAGNITVIYNEKAVDNNGNIVGNILSGDEGYIEGRFSTYEDSMGEINTCIFADKIILSNEVATTESSSSQQEMSNYEDEANPTIPSANGIYGLYQNENGDQVAIYEYSGVSDYGSTFVAEIDVLSGNAMAEMYYALDISSDTIQMLTYDETVAALITPADDGLYVEWRGNKGTQVWYEKIE